MAKKQKKKKGKQIRKATLASGFGAKHLIPELRKAEALMDRGQWQDALLVLTDLNRTNPNQSRVLDHLLSVYYELEYFVPYQSICEQFLALEPNNANINYVLAGVYVTNNYPLLALNTFQCCLERWPEHEQAETARDLIADLEQVRDSQLNDLKLTGPEGFGLAVLHEQAKAYLEEGEYDKSRQVEETLLQKRPNFLPAYNNLSLAAFLKGDTEGAITLCHQVLERDADNVHALSNLVRYQCAFGQYNAAVASAKRLKASQADAAEGWTKRAEALISVGDDAGILELYEQAQQTHNWDETTASSMFLHLVAVAMARTGQVQAARQKWQWVLQQQPHFSLARDNLDDLKQPLELQQGAWPFDLPYWAPKAVLEDLTQVIPNDNVASDEEIKTTLLNYFQTHPRVLAVLPILLDRGNPEGRTYAINLATLLFTLDHQELLKEFALSQRGTDQMRMDVAMTLIQADIFPSQEPIRIWRQGEWSEIRLLSYQFHSDPIARHESKVEKLLIKGNQLMRSGNQQDIQAAEKLFEQAINLEPDAPDLLNNLAGSYFMQQREPEAISVWTKIIEQFPDYVFARAALAQIRLKQGNIEAADQLLHPLLARQRFHVDEFAIFSRVQIMKLMAQDDLEGAKIWLNLWSSMDSEHPEVIDLQHRIEQRQRIKTQNQKLGSGKSV